MFWYKHTLRDFACFPRKYEGDVKVITSINGQDFARSKETKSQLKWEETN